MPDDLMTRLQHWGCIRPGVTELLERLDRGGFLGDATFVSRFVEDLDGADVARLDLVAVDEHLASVQADEILRATARRARVESAAWEQWRDARWHDDRWDRP